VTAMREYLDAMGRVKYAPPAPPEPPARVLAALRRRMLELARDHNRRRHPYLVTPSTRPGRTVLGRGPILAPSKACAGDRPTRARATARQHLAFT